MCRAASRTFPANHASARRGGIWALRVLFRWGLPEPACDNTLLLVSDLIDNAIAHTATPATLTLAVAEGSIEVAVADTAPLWMSGIPREAAAAMADTGAGQCGRDPMNLNSLDDEGAEVAVGGGQPVPKPPIAKRIWFRRSVPPWTGRSPTAALVTTPGLSTSRSPPGITQSPSLARGTETTRPPVLSPPAHSLRAAQLFAQMLALHLPAETAPPRYAASAGGCSDRSSGNALSLPDAAGL